MLILSELGIKAAENSIYIRVVAFLSISEPENKNLHECS